MVQQRPPMVILIIYIYSSRSISNQRSSMAGREMEGTHHFLALLLNLICIDAHLGSIIENRALKLLLLVDDLRALKRSKGVVFEAILGRLIK